MSFQMIVVLLVAIVVVAVCALGVYTAMRRRNPRPIKPENHEWIGYTPEEWAAVRMLRRAYNCGFPAVLRELVTDDELCTLTKPELLDVVYDRNPLLVARVQWLTAQYDSVVGHGPEAESQRKALRSALAELGLEHTAEIRAIAAPTAA